MRDYYAHRPEQRERKRVADRAYHHANAPALAETAKRYALAHREELREYQRAYYRKHADELKQRALAYVHTPKGRLVKRAVKLKRRAAQEGAVTEALGGADIEAIFAAWQHSCAYCGDNCSPLEIDHFVPLKRGGLHARHNIVPACRTCNASKHARDPWEFLATPGSPGKFQARGAM